MDFYFTFLLSEFLRVIMLKNSIRRQIINLMLKQGASFVFKSWEFTLMNSSACEGNSSGISRCKCFFFRGSASQSPFQSRIASDCIIRARLEPVLVAGAPATRSTGARRLVRNHQCWSSAYAPAVLSILLSATVFTAIQYSSTNATYQLPC